MGTRRSARTWALEISLALLAAALGGVFLLAALADDPPERLPPLGVQVAAGLAACAGLVLFRRRRPVALTLVLIPLGVAWVVPSGAVMVALFSVALLRPWRTTIPVAALHAAVIAVTYRLAIPDDRLYWEAVLVVVTVHVALVAVGMLVRSHRQLVRAAEIRARQAEEEQRLRVEEARHTERERLAREMHDVLAHRISLLAVHAGALEVRRDATDQERQAAAVIRQSAYEALEDLREVIGMLRDDPDDAEARRPQPTLTDLPALVEQSRRAGAPVTFDNRVADPPAVPARIGRHVYRIVQEALTNARKHAPGAAVRVSVAGPADAGLTVEVSNRMPVAAPAGIPGAGAGLIGLGERVASAGGRLEHGPTPDGDFRLRAWLPWRP